MTGQLDLFAHPPVHRGPPTAAAQPSAPALRVLDAPTPGRRDGAAENQTSGILRGSPKCETPDICAGRHGGNEQSAQANERGATGRAEQRARVLAEIERAGRAGLTCKELAERWGVGMNAISGRFTELKTSGDIWQAVDDNGNRIVRDGSSAWRV